MVDLHRHDEFSSFDGFGKPSELAQLAKSLGHTALSITNHGTTSGLVKHYEACKAQGIDCVMGVEAYFQPQRYDIDQRKNKPKFHLCLFAKNLKGYANLNRLMSEGEKNKYYTSIITFDMLKQFSEGVICSSACIQGMLSWAIKNGKLDMAKKAAIKFKKIFGDDFYIEIQPYIIDEEGTQEHVNVELMKLADELGIKMILTSDSHYGSRDVWDSYVKMHEIAAHQTYDLQMTYGERWMPTEKEIRNRCYKMHKLDIEKLGHNPKVYIQEMLDNVEEIHQKCEQNIFDNFELKLPKLSDDGKDSFAVLKHHVQQGLKSRGKGNNKKYIQRLKKELQVIQMHGFSDYFLMVEEYVSWAKSKGINVGPGRGSVCNCQVAWALYITDVDSLALGLDFRRFLREDKSKLPDVDLDFETSRRQEVINHLIETYPGHAAQICSYGLYKVDNLINDLAKVCGLDTTGDVDESDKRFRKSEIAAIKRFINDNIDTESEEFNYKQVATLNECKMYNAQYDGIIKHFSRLYKKVRFIGTHAAGVAITSDDLTAYCALKIKDDKYYTVYDLADLDAIHVVKFDMLGLKTMESIGELRKLTGLSGVTDEMLKDEKIYEMFRNGDTEGIFQFESSTAKSILEKIQCDCFEDVIAASSLNRPGPLSLKMPDNYANNKFNLQDAKESPFYNYTEETYGTIVYQEQVQLICVEIGNLSWSEADRVMKLMKNAIASMGELEKINRDKRELTEKFVAGAVSNGYDEKIARDMFEHILVYTFNKGHAAGYSLITMEEANFKLYYPVEFWATKLKYTPPSKANDAKISKFKEQAARGGTVLMLPHVNFSADYSIRKIEGEKVIQEGISSINGVGEKAALFIEAERKSNGIFTSYDDFYDRCKSRVVTSRVIQILKENGALEFDKKIYIKRVTKYNSALFARAQR